MRTGDTWSRISVEVLPPLLRKPCVCRAFVLLGSAQSAAGTNLGTKFDLRVDNPTTERRPYNGRVYASDLSGLHSQGDDLDDAMANANETFAL